MSSTRNGEWNVWATVTGWGGRGISAFSFLAAAGQRPSAGSSPSPRRQGKKSRYRNPARMAAPRTSGRSSGHIPGSCARGTGAAPGVSRSMSVCAAWKTAAEEKYGELPTAWYGASQCGSAASRNPFTQAAEQTREKSPCTAE